jgi:UV DNA damage repair endonuclease
MHKRIGFCCQWFHHDQSLKKKELEEIQRPFNTKATTVRWLNEHKEEAEEKLDMVVKHNIDSLKRLVAKAGTLPPERRMCRLGSPVLPMATEKTWRYFIESKEMVAYCEKHFAEVGDLARKLDVKVSFHPGQFTVLASETPDIVDRSIDEFEYHANMARWMGFGKSFQDGCKINVHISGRQGPAGIIKALPRLSPEARNLITIENDEMGHGLEKSLELEKHLALVMDIHHHWIRDEEYIEPNDDRVKRVIDSWRGVRPTMHYSYSRDTALAPAQLGDKIHTEMHNIKDLLDRGCKKQKLRAHSDLLPNRKVNDWALSFNEQFDIQVEAKGKNMAAEELYRQAQKNSV